MSAFIKPELSSFETITALKNYVDQKAVFKKDVIVTMDNLRYNDSNGKIVLMHEDIEADLTLSQTGASQLYGRIGIPYGYAMNTPSSLMGPHFNYYKSRIDSKEKFLMRLDVTPGRENLRALLSKDYAILDNEKVIESVLNVARKSNIELKNISVDSNADMLNIRGIFTDKVVYGINPDGHMSPYYSGFHYVNGETGGSSVSIDLIIYEEWCTNGAIKRVDGTSLLRRVHRGAIDLAAESSKTFDTIIEMSESGLDSFMSTREIQIKNPNLYLEKKMNQNPKLFTKPLREIVMNEFSMRPDPTLYGITSAMTATAKGLNFRDRLNLETYAGKLIFEGGNDIDKEIH